MLDIKKVADLSSKAMDNDSMQKEDYTNNSGSKFSCYKF